MPSITTQHGVVHFEVNGRGSPIIFLHGWLGSWGLWQETMDFLSGYYRTYALDFWGFGESGKKSGSFTVPDFVSMVGQFMENLGIHKAPLVGHSMGGTVSLSFALQNPDKVSKVVIIGSPIVGSSLSLMFQPSQCSNNVFFDEFAAFIPVFIEYIECVLIADQSQTICGAGPVFIIFRASKKSLLLHRIHGEIIDLFVFPF